MKKYQKIIALASILVIAVVVTVLVVYFNSIEKENSFKLGDYTVVAQGAGVAIVSYDGEETSVEVPASIDKKKIVAIKEGAFNDTSVIKITFAEGADIELEDAAFANNTVLQTIELPSNATSVPKNCFIGCTSLNTVVMPDSITFIGSHAFSQCTNLTNNYTADTDNLRWLELPKNLKEICDYAFYECKGLDCIRVSDKLELIDAYAFSNSGLQKIGMYDDQENLAIQEIGSHAFYKTQLRLNLKTPALTKIGTYAFSSIQSNTITKEENSYTLPSSVTSIGDYAFSGCSGLIKFTFAKDEEGDVDLTIGKYVLASCTSLAEVTFERSVKEIPEGMFMGCVKLLTSYDLTLPEEVQTIGSAAFALYVSSLQNTTFYCNNTINFKRDGYDTPQSYNDYFRVTQLTQFATSSSAAETTKHFVITEYYGTEEHTRPTELYAYVGLYAKDSSWHINDSETATSFKFFVEKQAELFASLQVIKNSAFAGAKFDKLCLPGRCTDYEKNAFYQSDINAFYIDNTCLDYTCTIDKDAFDNLNTSLDEVKLLVLDGGSNFSKRFYASQIKAQLDEIYLDLCLPGDSSKWPN